jgi:YesN/AraC family two-component response regulator
MNIYKIEGKNVDEVWEINKTYKNSSNLLKQQKLSFLEIALNYQTFLDTTIFEFNIQTKHFALQNHLQMELGEVLNFFYVSKGEATFGCGGVETSFRAGEWGVSNYKIKNVIYMQKEATDATVTHVVVNRNILKEMLETDSEISSFIEDILENRVRECILFRGFLNSDILEMVRQIWIYKKSESKVEQVLASLKIRELFLKVLSWHFSQKEEKIAQKSLKLIHEKAGDITVKELAKNLGVSETTIRNHFKDEFGERVSFTIFKTKMFQAQHYLQTHKSISYKELAQKVGYTNSHRLKKDMEKFFG